MQNILINLTQGLSSNFYVCDRELGQFSYQTWSGAGKVGVQIIFKKFSKVDGISSPFSRMALLVTLFLVLINIFNSVR